MGEERHENRETAERGGAYADPSRLEGWIVENKNGASVFGGMKKETGLQRKKTITQPLTNRTKGALPMLSKEELKALKEEIEALKEKLAELTKKLEEETGHTDIQCATMMECEVCGYQDVFRGDQVGRKFACPSCGGIGAFVGQVKAPM